MRGRVRGDLCAGREAPGADPVFDGAGVALTGIHTDNFDRAGPPPGLLMEPSPQTSGTSPVEHVDHPAGGVDRGGGEPAPAPAGGRGHGRLIEPDPRGRTHPGGIAGPLTSDRLDRGPHRGPPHAEPAGQRRNRPPHRAQPVCGPPDRPGSEHPPRPGQRGPLGPGPHPGSAQAHTRSFHNTRSARPPPEHRAKPPPGAPWTAPGARNHRRTPAAHQGVCTPTTTSPPTSPTPVTSNPAAPNHTAELP